MVLKSIAKKDKKTKELVKRLEIGDIAVIDHMDIDEVAARSILERKPSLVINANRSISGRYPNLGPKILLNSGILILDNVGEDTFKKINENDLIEVIENLIYRNGELLGVGVWMTEELVFKKIEDTKANLKFELDKFIDNTLEYAKKEKDILLGNLKIPIIKTDFEGRHSLVVVRGQDYKQDLLAIKSYIDEFNPILIGVDGGGDALMEFGYIPHIVVGDMDSVSDRCLRKCTEIIVHAYPNGRAPGLNRIKDLGLNATIFPAPGTSEDIAMIIAFEKGSELIVAVGTHTNMIDFLEKGRKGMASTFLVRMKVGSKLVDAKGVNKLYRESLRLKHILLITLGALLPIFIVSAFSSPIQQLIKLLIIRLRFIFGLKGG